MASACQAAARTRVPRVPNPHPMRPDAGRQHQPSAPPRGAEAPPPQSRGFGPGRFISEPEIPYAKGPAEGGAPWAGHGPNPRPGPSPGSRRAAGTSSGHELPSARPPGHAGVAAPAPSSCRPLPGPGLEAPGAGKRSRAQGAPPPTWRPAACGHRPWEVKGLVLMKERPLFTAAFVLSSPSFVPSLAARISFCTCGGGAVRCAWSPRTGPLRPL